MHKKHKCKPVKPVEHKAQLASLHGHVPSINVKLSRHFLHVPYSGESYSLHEYSKQVLFPLIIILININKKKEKNKLLFIFFSK